ncbi:MAG: hypothetical protein U5N58_05165 [Actinomycetota bacterium]|nr:hypothetical protein [Actinomycetota bacterium]
MDKQKPNIGLFITVDQLYSSAFDMFDIDKVVEGDVKKLIDSLSVENKVHFNKIARTESDGQQIGREFAGLNLDLIIISQFVYTLDEPIIGFLKEIRKDVPVLVLMVQGYKGIPGDLTVTDFSRSWGINGTLQMTASIPNMVDNFDYEFLVGNPGEEKIMRKINRMARASWAVNSIKKANVAYLPGFFKGMHDNWDNAAKLEKVFGVRLDWLTFSDLVKQFNFISEDQINQEVEQIKDKYKVVEPRQVDFV